MDPHTEFDVDQLRANCELAEIVYRDELGSTNDLAKELAKTSNFLTPTLVLTRQQPGGRGRMQRTWQSGPGNIALSWIIRPTNESLDSPSKMSWQIKLAFVSALAVDETVCKFVDESHVHLKWPNDVLVRDKKIAGVLIESVVGRASANDIVAIVGIGLNVNVPAKIISEHDPELLARSTSLIDQTNRRHSLTDVTIHLITGLKKYADLCRLTSVSKSDPNEHSPDFRVPATDSFDLQSAYNRRLGLVGKTVTISADGTSTPGFCSGIDAAGSLVLQTSAGPKHFLSGTISG